MERKAHQVITVFLHNRDVRQTLGCVDNAEALVVCCQKVACLRRWPVHLRTCCNMLQH